MTKYGTSDPFENRKVPKHALSHGRTHADSHTKNVQDKVLRKCTCV